MTAVLLITILAAGLLVLGITVEAVRAGHWELGSGGVADAIPEGFYSADPMLPDVMVDNAGWIVTAAIAWIVVGALLIGRRTSRRR